MEYNYDEVMQRCKKRSATKCMLISIVDAHNGYVEMDTSYIKSVHSRPDDGLVVLKLQDGSSKTLGTADIDKVDSDIREWKTKHNNKFANIISSM